MKCPIDGETLAMTERHGIEIDYCPRCRGVWLDRGELDKIIERADRGDAAPRTETVRATESRARRSDKEESRKKERKDERREKPYSRSDRTRKFIREIFDF